MQGICRDLSICLVRYSHALQASHSVVEREVELGLDLEESQIKSTLQTKMHDISNATFSIQLSIAFHHAYIPISETARRDRRLSDHYIHFASSITYY